MTYREDVEGQDASILMHPRVWEASGHVENFTDPMVDCKQCKSRFRLDVLGESINDKKKEKVLKALAEQVKGSDKESVVSDIINLDITLNEKIEKILENDSIASDFLTLVNCPKCGTANSFTEPRTFNLMFKTFIGGHTK